MLIGRVSGSRSVFTSPSPTARRRSFMAGSQGTPRHAKTVAIIGAGPSGLVAAKRMLDAGLSPLVLDKAPGIGGMWGDNNSANSSLWSSLKTNLSRYTCVFTDLAWPLDTPDFPDQHEMGAYLARFSALLPPDCLAPSCTVTRMERMGDQWTLHWASPSGSTSRVFDHVVIATGFFSTPHQPPLPGRDTFPGNIIHSTDYRSPEVFAGKRVVVVGASFSGADIAADVAGHSASVVHVASHPFWSLPKYLPLNPTSPASPFLPVDLVLYRRSKQKLASPPMSILEKRTMANQYFRSMLGDPPFRTPTDGEPPYVVVSTSYPGHVQAGRILVQPGRVQSLCESAVVLEDGVLLSDVDAIILCTGYRTSLPFLPPGLLDDCDFNDPFAPLLLHRTTFHPNLPGVAFVGMYRGPCFAVQELQARWAAAVFSGAQPAPSDAAQWEGIKEARAVREQVPRSQFPHEYVALADSLAAELGHSPTQQWNEQHNVVVPGHYCAAVAEAATAEVEAACTAFEHGRMVAAVVFRSLPGRWRFRRVLTSRLTTSPSGVVVGEASFSAIARADAPNQLLFREQGNFTLDSGPTMRAQREYVYTYNPESDLLAVFHSDSGARGNPFLSLKFLPPHLMGNSAGAGAAGAAGGGGPQDHPAQQPSQSPGEGDGKPHDGAEGWRAVGSHLCGKDMYFAFYRFSFAGINLTEFEIKFKVQGPDKDYDATALFTRS